jgi:hypothetical protein
MDDTKPSKESGYNYIDKSGPRISKYNANEGGKLTYKQKDQTTAKGALKENPYEPICKGRNLIIIVGDPRILNAVYSNGRRLAVVQTTADLKTASIKIETV